MTQLDSLATPNHQAEHSCHTLRLNVLTHMHRLYPSHLSLPQFLLQKILKQWQLRSFQPNAWSPWVWYIHSLAKDHVILILEPVLIPPKIHWFHFLYQLLRPFSSLHDGSSLLCRAGGHYTLGPCLSGSSSLLIFPGTLFPHIPCQPCLWLSHPTTTLLLIRTLLALIVLCTPINYCDVQGCVSGPPCLSVQELLFEGLFFYLSPSNRSSYLGPVPGYQSRKSHTDFLGFDILM